MAAPDIAACPKRAMCGTAPCWQELFSRFAALVGAAHARRSQQFRDIEHAILLDKDVGETRSVTLTRQIEVGEHPET
jgi:hypothetical protein